MRRGWTDEAIVSLTEHAHARGAEVGRAYGFQRGWCNGVVIGLAIGMLLGAVLQAVCAP